MIHIQSHIKNHKVFFFFISISSKSCISCEFSQEESLAEYIMHHEDPNSALLSFCNRKHPPQMFEIDISKNVIFLLPPFKSNLLDNFSFQIYLQGTCLKSRMENTQTPRAMSKSNIRNSSRIPVTTNYDSEDFHWSRQNSDS